MQVTTIGLDLAKSVFLVHGADAKGQVIVTKKLRRAEVLAFFEALPPGLIGMEACATAHHWARALVALGHDVAGRRGSSPSPWPTRPPGSSGPC